MSLQGSTSKWNGTAADRGDGPGSRSWELFDEQQQVLRKRTDRWFGGLMIVQWLAAIAAALWFSPRTWEGSSSSIHPNLWAALLLGGVMTAFPVLLVWKRPGRTSTRHVVAISQMLFSALLIHLTAGRIETHFHVFGSLAFLAFYRDWRVLVTATVVVAGDHFVRGVWWPTSVFGVMTSSPWRWMEHAAWVLFEDFFLVRYCVEGEREIWRLARQQAELEKTNEQIEQTVRERTAQLAVSELRFSRVLDSLPLGAYTCDNTGRISYFNQRAAEVWGRAPELNSESERFCGSLRQFGADGAIVRKEQSGLAIALRDGVDVAGCEVAIERPDGTRRTVLAHINLMRDEKGRVDGAVNVFLDITERKQTEEALRMAKREAEVASRAKGEFLANMSHEIRTPMNGVLGFADLLLDSSLNAEQREFAAIIKSSGEGLLVLLDDILDFSKIEAGKLTVETIDYDIAVVAQQISKLVAPRAASKGIKFTTICDPALPANLAGDPVRIRQVLLNLVGNALKFTERGEVKVEIAVGRPPSDRLELSGGPGQIAPPRADACVVVRVRDTGIGIARDKQEQLFQKFTQADASTTRRFGGTGLGLAISRQLVELMGGLIGLESEPGLGSTFWFTLPLAEGGQRAARPAEPDKEPISTGRPAEAGESPCRVLLAEDNITNQMLALRLLERLRCQSDLARDGREAVEMAARTRYDIIFMDCHMPEMDGFQATAEIRRIEAEASGGVGSTEGAVRRGRRVPIVALTASAFECDRDACATAGMDDFLTKPISMEELRRVLIKWGGRTERADLAA